MVGAATHPMLDPWRSLARRTRGIAVATAALIGALGLLAAPRAHAQRADRLGAPGDAPPAHGLGRELGDPAEPARPVHDAPSGWAFDLAAITSLPLSVGAEATLTTPVGLFAALSIGHTPQAYLDVVTSALGDADVYDDELDPMVDEAIANGAWNVRASIGVTIPEGLELAFGYTWLSASADLSPRSIEVAVGQRLSWPGMTVVPMSITLHALHGRIGWRFVIEDHLVLRAALGWTHTVSSDAHVEVPPEVRALPNDPATRVETSVQDGIAEYGFTPELLLSAGYRF